MVQFSIFSNINADNNLKLLLIAATNKPMNLNEDLLKFFGIKIYCPPLDEKERYLFIKNTINKVENTLNDKDIKDISKLTNEYSNEDLLKLCKEAAFQPVKELDIEQILKIEKLRPLVKNDLLNSMNKIKGSLNKKIITEFLEWKKKEY